MGERNKYDLFIKKQDFLPVRFEGVMYGRIICNYVHPKYGEKEQFSNSKNTSPVLGNKGNQFIQQVNDTFLFHAWAINSMMLPGLSTITSEQAPPTKTTKKK